VHEHAEVAELLGNFVRGRREPCSDAEPDIDQERARDSEAADEIVQPVAEQYQIVMVAAGFARWQ
jgi:hypothetical protein